LQELLVSIPRLALPRRRGRLSPHAAALGLSVALGAALIGPLAYPVPASAQSFGGNGGFGNHGLNGGLGGDFANPGAGGASSSASGAGAGGGGGGGTAANGGAGGNDFSGTGGGTAGTANGGGGGNATTADGGGGGGGGGFLGFNVAGSGVSPNIVVTGGTGGAGGTATNGGGGGGGSGGTGVSITNQPLTASITGSSTIQGGTGGTGGAATVGTGGNGGDGGAGLTINGSGSTIIIGDGHNTMSITGGTGGTGASGGTGHGADGRGGAGIEALGTGVSITVNALATVTGGNSAGGVQGNAITFTGGANTLNLAGGTLSGNIAVSGSVNFSQSGTVTLSNAITDGPGAGSVIYGGIGTLTLSGANTYTGGTTLSAGTIAVGNNSALGTGTLAMAAGTTLSFANTGNFHITNNITVAGDPTFTTPVGTTQTISGVISDGGTPGAVVINGGGTLVLSGNNTYSGGTTICGTTGANPSCGASGGASILQLGVDTVLNIPGHFNSGIVSSAIGTGTLTFDGGMLQAQAGLSERNVANAVQITANGGTVDSGSGFFRFTGNITDAPGSSGGTFFLKSTGAGIERDIILAGNNTYSGITYIDSGIVIANSATALSPNSAFQVNTGGTVTLSGFSNSIASLADGASGGGIVQNASASGTAVLTITGAAGGTTSFSGVLRDGTGGEGGHGGPVLAIVKDGPGKQIFAGTNQYSGTTTINGGVLEIDGSIAPSSMTTANSGAALTGIGTVGNTTIAGGGVFAPGSGTPGSSMTVAGSLALQSGAMYVVMLNPTTASFAHVTGTATLSGANVNAFYANGSYISKQYTILTAGSVSGTFGALVNSNLPANFTTSLSYDPTHAFLNLTLNFAPPPAGSPNFGSGLNINQQNVANALTNFFNATGGIPMVFGTLTPAGLTQASGESATGSQQATFDAMNLFMGIMTDPFVAGRNDGGSTNNPAPGYADEGFGVSAYAPNDTPRSQSERDAYAAIYRKAPPVADTFTQRWSVWAAAYGGSQTTSGNATLGSNSATSSIAGTVVGADYRISPYTLAGFALAGGGTSFSTAGSGSGHSDLFQAGAFIRHTVGQAYITGALAYGWQDITTNRTLTIAGIDQLRAEFNANAFSGRVEGGYRFVSPWIGGIGITPYAAGQFTTFDLPAYAESVVSGASTFALAYGARDVTDTRSELGIRTDKSYAMQDAILTLRGRFAWAHDFNPDRSIGATFQALPGASFVVNGAAQASDSALTTASVEMKWRSGWSAAATFEGEFSNVTSSYAGKGVVRYTW
jgi:autotransporter-associated beta strand protein